MKKIHHWILKENSVFDKFMISSELGSIDDSNIAHNRKDTLTMSMLMILSVISVL